MSDNEISWKHCPGCGERLQNLDTQKFCINCGLDLLYVKQHKTLPPQPVPTTYAPIKSYQPSFKPVQSYQPSVVDYKKYEPLSDDEVRDTSGRVLWGKWASIGIPLVAFVVMNCILLIFILALILIVPIDVALTIVMNPLFIILLTLIELVLIIFPLWYVRKYLENPNLKNRLILLGFTTRGYSQKEIAKEVGIGIGFAFIGIGVVVGASLLMQFILYLFGVRFVESSSGDAESIVTGMTVFFLILMILMMMVIVGPMEEILFRGFMMKGLTRTIGKRGSLFLTAFIFAIIHLVGLIFILFISPIIFLILFVYFFVPYLAISILLGVLFNWREENLIAVVIMHGVYNSITIIIAFLYMVFY